jgi:hypothetical protein
MLISGRTPTISFYVRGSDDEDSLIVTTERFKGRLALELPATALPWRDLRLIEKWGRRREPYGCCEVTDPLDQLRVGTKGPDVEIRTGIRGADTVDVSHGLATVMFPADTPMVIPCLRIAPGVAMPAAVRVTTLRQPEGEAAVHIAQLSGGRRTGGVTLAIGRELQRGSDQRS